MRHQFVRLVYVGALDWGARNLMFVGTANLEKTRALLNPMGYEPPRETAACGYTARTTAESCTTSSSVAMAPT